MNSFILLLTISLFIFLFFILPKIMEKKILKDYNELLKRKETLSWIIYKYKFLKKMKYVEYLNPSFFKNKILSKTVEDSDNYKNNKCLSIYILFNQKTCDEIKKTIEKNKPLFNNIYINDSVILFNENLIKDLDTMINLLENRYPRIIAKYEQKNYETN